MKPFESLKNHSNLIEYDIIFHSTNARQKAKVISVEPSKIQYQLIGYGNEAVVITENLIESHYTKYKRVYYYKLTDNRLIELRPKRSL